MANSPLNKLISMINFDTWDSQEKQRFHNSARAVLRTIAKHLELEKGAFNISSNKAGPAVTGEITLHTDKLYLTIGGLERGQVMYRSCNGQKDYTGGRNRWARLENVLSASFLEDVRRIQYS